MKYNCNMVITLKCTINLETCPLVDKNNTIVFERIYLVQLTCMGVLTKISMFTKMH